MKVLAITTYEDYKSGLGPTAVIELPDGVHEDDAYLLWHNKEYETNLTRADIDKPEKVGNAWRTREVQTLSSLKERQ